MGPGTVVIGLASVIIGTSLLRKVTLVRVTTSVVIGSILYKACVAIAIKIGMPSSDLKLITAVLFLVILVISMERKTRIKTADYASGGPQDTGGAGAPGGSADSGADRISDSGNSGTEV